MKTWVLMIFLLFAAAQSLFAKTSHHKRYPAQDIDISNYYLGNDTSLHIVFRDEHETVIPLEHGRFSDGERIVTQETFSDIKISKNNRCIGWIADYGICAQSYPCSAALVIFQAGHKLTYISPPAGILWKWSFLCNGKRVVAQFGFPHGDETGAYALYDSESGRKLAECNPAETTQCPKWVEALRHAGEPTP